MRIQAAFACVQTQNRCVAVYVFKDKESIRGSFDLWLGHCYFYRSPVILLPDNGTSPMMVVGEKVDVLFVGWKQKLIEATHSPDKYDIPLEALTPRKNLFGKKIPKYDIAEGVYLSKEAQITTYVSTIPYELSMPEVFQAEQPVDKAPEQISPA